MIAGLLPPNLHEWDAATMPLHAEALYGVCAQTMLMRGRTTRPALTEMAAVLYRHFTHWRLVDLAGCGHMAPLAQAELVNRYLVDFLESPAHAHALA